MKFDSVTVYALLLGLMLACAAIATAILIVEAYRFVFVFR